MTWNSPPMMSQPEGQLWTRSVANTTNNVDEQFGPFIAQYFDFTRLFEETVLSIGPSAVFLCAFPFRVLWLWNKPRIVSGGILHSNKLIALSIFTTLQITCLGLWAAPGTPKSGTSVTAAGLTVADALALCILSHLDHLRSVRPSVIINIYILLSLPMDVVRVRTLWIRGGSYHLAAAFTSTVSIKLLVFIIEAIEKRDILLAEYRHYSPESTSGIYSRSFFWWLNPLLRDGFKKVLTDEDLYPVDVDMRAEAIQQQLSEEWTREANKKSKHAFLWRTLLALKWPLANAVFPRLCVTFFQYMQPFLINAVLKFLLEPIDTQSTNIGWGLTAAYGLDYLGLAIANGAFMHQTFRMVTIARGAIISIIYSQTVDLNLTSVDESAALTLMSTDVERICLALEAIHDLWSSLIEIGLGIFLLHRQIHLAALGPALLCATSGTAVLIMATRYASKAQRIWVEAIQTRIDSTSKVLGGMKAVKMLGLTDTMRSLVQKLRTDEIRTAQWFRRLGVLRLGLGKGSEVLAPGLAFAAYTAICNATGRTLEVGTAYSSLSIVTLVVVPLALTIQRLPIITSAIGCFDRIQDFLNLPAQKDHRLERSSRLTPYSSTRSFYSDIELHELATLPPSDSNAIIQVEHASFSWNELSPVIQDVSFRIIQGSLTFVVGPVGSGKSTLLKGLVGETPSTKGFVYTKSLKAGFVDQSSWIQNGTLQSNILGVLMYDRDWYRAVIHACCLKDDIEILPKRDLTMVGSAGISLSGGQKQRVALARAVYSKEKLLILDDCFSGLDATTEDRIFSRLLGRNGILRTSGATVILVTHAVHRLSFADNILVLNPSGQITEQGTFSHLMEHGSYVSGLESKHKMEDSSQDNLDDLLTTMDTYRNPAEDIEIARAEEDANRQVGDWATYKYYLKSGGWGNTLCFVGGIIGFSVFMKLPDLWVTFWTKAVQENGNSVNNFYVGIFVLFECTSVFWLMWTSYFGFLKIVPASSKKLHQVILNTVMAAPLSFFTSTDTGITVNRFSQDMALIDRELPDAALELCACIALGIIQAIFMCLSAGYFAAVMPLVLFVMYILQMYYLRTSRQLRLLDLEAKSPLYSHFMETLEGLVTIRAFGWSENFESKNARLLDTSQKPFYLLFCIQRWLGLVLDLTVASLTVVLMVMVVKLRAVINPGLVGLALVNVNGFNLSLTELIKAWTLLETSMGAISRVKSFSEDTAGENLPTENEVLPANLIWPSQGNIEITNLWAGYKPDVPVVKNLTLTISAGQRVGICGPSGSGKSSIIATLFRMLEISSGGITIDGVDISRLPRQDVRMHINSIPQDAYFFKGTVRTNIDPLSRCTDDQLIDALKKATLWSIVESKGGLDALAEAEMFSHGQRQLFCLARAILHPSKIVVLDEVTSSVDLPTDELMQKIIREEFMDCTILAVAHRLDTIMDFDRIAVLKAGELIEFDTPKELMSRNSAFKALYESGG